MFRRAPQSQFLIYQAGDGRLKIDVRFEGETVWLSQKGMAELFQKDVRTVSEHIKAIFDEGELQPASGIRKFRITASDGKNYETQHYDLDVIIAVGYRVHSLRGTQFRIWATRQLREFIVKGFVLDDERLKNPDLPFDYFEELLRRIQDIRTSERRFYQKITDIYATSVDYDPTTEMSLLFFKTVQNKMHWAIGPDGCGNHSQPRGQRQTPHGVDLLARGQGTQAGRGCCQELPEGRGTSGSQQPGGTIPPVCGAAGQTPRPHAHVRLDCQTGRLPQPERKKYSHPCGYNLTRTSFGPRGAGV
jgi:hypothetical protein